MHNYIRGKLVTLDLAYINLSVQILVRFGMEGKLKSGIKLCGHFPVPWWLNLKQKTDGSIAHALPLPN
jgi:hypothetical protein